MKKNSLTEYSRIKPENIDKNQFTLSLLNEALNTGILTTKEVEEIQIQLIELLSTLIPKYTNNRSSSVKVEVAQSITQSILYNIDIYLRALPSLEQAMHALQTTNISKLYEQGLSHLDIEVKETEKLLQEVQNSKLCIPLRIYNDTIDNGFHDTFDTYNPKFDGHNAACNIDYPLLFDDMSLTGMLYIKKYLTHLKIENDLCAYFPQNDINELLKGCCQTLKLDIEDLVVNICEVILKNALCSIIINKKGTNLIINKDDFHLLESHLQKLPNQKLLETFLKAMDTLFTQLNITNPHIKSYLQPFIHSIYPHILTAVKENALDGFIVVTKELPMTDMLYYASGKKLSDENLRVVIDMVMNCKTGEEKAALIESTIHNLEDLLDIFNSYCIYDDEYISIFNRMEDYEIAVLTSDLIDLSPSSDSSNLSIDTWYRSENKQCWQKHLIKYLESIEKDRYSNILKIVLISIKKSPQETNKPYRST